MDSVLIIILIVLLTLVLIVTLFMLFVCSGLFTNIKVGAGSPPIENALVLYKFSRGSYKNTSPIFTDITAIAPKNKSLAIYYDDRDQVPTDELRWAVGVIVAEGNAEPDNTLVAKFKKEGFTEFTFPSIQNVVKATFPCPTQISVLLGIYMVYPKLAEYVKERRLCAHPWIEIYDGENIHYMAPLSKQDQFYVPEAHIEMTNKEEKRLLRKGEEAQIQEEYETLEGKGGGHKEPSTVRPTEGSRCSASDSSNIATPGLLTDITKVTDLAGTRTENLPLRSQSVHVVHCGKGLLSKEVRSSSVNTTVNRDKAANSTPLRLSQLDFLTDQSNDCDAGDSFEFNSSLCSSSNIADSDISTASSSYDSSEYSCSTVNTVQNSSVNSDFGKSDIEHVEDGNKLCKEL